jgi:hypothetical protein
VIKREREKETREHAVLDSTHFEITVYIVSYRHKNDTISIHTIIWIGFYSGTYRIYRVSCMSYNNFLFLFFQQVSQLGYTSSVQGDFR